MKKVIAALLLLPSFAFAQPLLTAATNNPVAGDKFVVHLCDNTGINSGPAGAGVTWDYSALTGTTTDIISYVSCATTPFCDSFPSATLAYDMSGGTYTYVATSAAGFDYVGIMGPGGASRYVRRYRFIGYPLAYNTLRVDTAAIVSGNVPLDTTRYMMEDVIDSYFCDAYGTLILPTGTVSSVLRVREMEYVWDSGWHAPVRSFMGWDEIDYFFVAGLHYPLMQIGYTFESGAVNAREVWYTTPLPTGVQQLNPPDAALSVYPNPANDVTHIRFVTDDAEQTSVALTDIAGKAVYTTDARNIRKGENDITIPVASLPAGIYLCRLQSPGAGTTCKLVVVR